MDVWRRPDGTLATTAFLAHALNICGDPAERVGLDLDGARASIVTRPAWHDQAACKGMSVAVFIPRPGAPIATAKAVCAECAVIAACRQAGIDGNEVGVWGGERRSQRSPRGALAAAWIARRTGQPPERRRNSA